jgi:hypothetical protein
VVSGYTGGTYDGTAHTQTVTVTGVLADGQMYTTSLADTNAGSYSQAWSFSSNSNYSPVGGTLMFTIAKANATISVTPYSLTYDGTAHSAVGSATGVQGESLGGLALSATTHTNAGTFSDSWSFSGGNNYNNIASTPITDVIGKASVTYTIGNDSQTYGTPANLAHDLPATIATGVNGETFSISYASTGDSATAHVGSYPITGALADGSGALSNYVVTLNRGTLTVNPFAFTIQIGNDTQVAGTPANLAADLGTTIATGVNGQALAITYASTGDTDSAAPGAYPITATLADGSGLTSDYNVTLRSGVLTVTVTGSIRQILVLDPSAPGSLKMSGNSVINESGWPVYVNSNSATAVQLSGNASLTASAILDVGGYQKSGNAVIHPTPVTGSAAAGDPLANMQAPNIGSSQGPVNLGGNSSQTIQPGTYTQITVFGNANLTLTPGVYVVTSGGFLASGNATIKGSGVVIYLASGSVNLSGNSVVLLTAPIGGAFNGVGIFQGRSDMSTLYLSGNAYLSSGAIYAPHAALNLSGNSNLSAPLIVGQLALSGNADPSPVPPIRSNERPASLSLGSFAFIHEFGQGSLPGSLANTSSQNEAGENGPNNVQSVLDQIMAKLSGDERMSFADELLDQSASVQGTDSVFADLANVCGDLGSIGW